MPTNLCDKVENALITLGTAGITLSVGSILYNWLNQSSTHTQDAIGACFSLTSTAVTLTGAVPQLLREKSRKLDVEIKNYRDLVREWLPVLKEWLPTYGMYQIGHNLKIKDKNSSQTLRKLRSGDYINAQGAYQIALLPFTWLPAAFGLTYLADVLTK